jgi:hypothetical protein
MKFILKQNKEVSKAEKKQITKIWLAYFKYI